VDDSTQQVFVLNRVDTVSVFDAKVGGTKQQTPTSPVAPIPTSPVAPACCGARFFPQTGHNLRFFFLAFWLRYGGIDTFGYPRTEPLVESGHLVQYTDRFELEVVNSQVRTGPLGRRLTGGRSFARVTAFPSTSTRRYFPSTGHSLSGRFLAYWQSHHGATLLGAPISEVIVEGNNDGSGRRYPLQWFENGRLEDHPELAGTPYAMELGLLGVQALQQRGWLP
jgi:hypothetical protein